MSNRATRGAFKRLPILPPLPVEKLSINPKSETKKIKPPIALSSGNLLSRLLQKAIPRSTRVSGISQYPIPKRKEKNSYILLPTIPAFPKAESTTKKATTKKTIPAIL